MTSDELAAAAVRNRQTRLSQVAALRPKRLEARERAEEMRTQGKAVKQTGQRVAFVRSMLHVPGFFPTPPPIVARMIEAADLSGSMRILEPSCGKGNIAAPLHAAGHAVYGVEVIQGLADYCKAQGLSVQRADFMDLTLRDFSLAEGVGGFDRVLMNPPFEKRQDELHIKHAFEFLRPGGRLVAICTSMTANRIGTWVIFRGGLIEALPEGCFQTSERPTGVNVVLITIDK